MQMSIHYKEGDQYLINQLEKEADRKRLSKSAALLNILEQYFEAGKRIGQILQDMGAIDEKELQETLDRQRENGEGKRIGEIMMEAGLVAKDQINTALEIQAKSANKGGPTGPTKKKLKKGGGRWQERTDRA